VERLLDAVEGPWLASARSGLTSLPSFDFLYRSYLASGDERFLQVAHDLLGSIRPTTNSRLFNAFVKKVRRLSEGEAASLQRG